MSLISHYCPQFEYVIMEHPEITYASIQLFGKFSKLSHVGLCPGRRSSPGALKYLVHLPIQRLNMFFGLELTNETVKHLRQLTQLTYLTLPSFKNDGESTELINADPCTS
ncbi:hypothetical protein G6F56_009303 [Rhizopus delemar]|nr:hypothetical protein G6F56_009303 [Rhizopus delemar]